MNKNKCNILYLGSSKDGSAPADRRRFLGFSSRSNNLNIHYDEEKGIKYDVLVCSLGGDLVKALRLANTIPKLVLDYTNHYLVEKSWVKNRFRNLISGLFGNKELSFKAYKNIILEVMCRADLVVCPSITQQKYLKYIGIASTRLTDFFGQEIDLREVNYDGDGSLFWEGQACNLVTLKVVSPVLKNRPDLLLRIVSDESFGMLGGKLFKKSSSRYCSKILPNYEFSCWNAENLNANAKKSSLGIIPLDLTDQFVAAKPENKLVLMWQLGLYTLCSPSESYNMLSKETGIDFLCSDEEQWSSSIECMLSDIKQRKEYSAYLHNFACSQYSDDAIRKKWQNAFEQASIF